MAGFGGVAEYGITVRWDKNFLKIIRLLLERRREFAMFGGVRFGGTLERRGCVRAGVRSHRARGRGRTPDGARHSQRPRARSPDRLGFPDGAAAHRRRQGRLDRQSADTPARRGHRRRPDRHRHRDRVACLLSVQVEKFLARYETLVRRARRACCARRLERRRKPASPTSSWLMRRALRAERDAAKAQGREPAPARAASVLGRSDDRLSQAAGRLALPTRLNHEEIEKALEEGISFAEGLSPSRIEVDEFGHARAVRFARTG